jgi:Thiolase, C-terminal domain
MSAGLGIRIVVCHARSPPGSTSKRRASPTTCSEGRRAATARSSWTSTRAKHRPTSSAAAPRARTSPASQPSRAHTARSTRAPSSAGPSASSTSSTTAGSPGRSPSRCARDHRRRRRARPRQRTLGPPARTQLTSAERLRPRLGRRRRRHTPHRAPRVRAGRHRRRRPRPHRAARRHRLRNHETSLSGRIPTNVSGGLLSRGHPLGATGCAQLVELADQLRDRCGPRQVHGARLALAHNAGGHLGDEEAATVVIILERAPCRHGRGDFHSAPRYPGMGTPRSSRALPS